MNWQQVYALLIKLSNRIRESGFTPDLIVGVSRGGLVPLRVISDLLENSNVAIIRVEFYSGIGEKKGEPKITQLISVPVIDKKVLILDDVSDSGESLRLVSKELSLEANIAKSSTLYYKPWSCFKPDYYVRETTSWIVFPWEIHETVKALGSNMFKEGKSRKATEIDLIKIGFAPYAVERVVEDIWKNLG